MSSPYLLIDHAPEAEITTFLVKTESETMGLSRTNRVQKHAAEIASVLTDSRDFLIGKTVAQPVAPDEPPTRL
jgi:hypothetical protein